MASTKTWTLKTGRPGAVPGCQNTESLYHLKDDETECGDNNFCYYFRCRKCLPLLALDYLNPDYRQKMIFIPHIDSIQPPKLFSTDAGYQGEVVEFVENFLSRISAVKGIALNGWKNDHAKQLFDSVETTFDGKNFELDWIIFNGSSLTVVEIGMRGESEENEKSAAGKQNRAKEVSDVSDEKGIQRLVSRKIDQVIKDLVIIDCLMEASDCRNIDVILLAVFPNIPIEEVSRRIAGKYKSSLDNLINSTARPNRVHFGVISSDSMVTKAVYMYKGGGQLEEPTEFDLVMTSESDWSGSYRYLSSLVITSRLMVGKTAEISEQLLMTSPERSLEQSWLPGDQKDTLNFLGVETGKRSKGKSMLPVGLVLGPEQLSAIKCNKRLIILAGEAGCGKTTALLAVLLKNAGKHRPASKLRKVIFYIPREKTQFRKDLYEFIRQNCVPGWTQVLPFIAQNFTSRTSENVYIIDEIYATGEKFIKNILISGGHFYIALISGQSSELARLMFYTLPRRDTAVFFFRNIYRTRAEISKCSSKLRRYLDNEVNQQSNSNQLGIISRVPWAMSFRNGAPMRYHNSIIIQGYEDSIAEILPLIPPAGSSRALIVTWMINSDNFDLIESNFPDHVKEHVRVTSLTIKNFKYTGSEFQNVAIILGHNLQIDSESCYLLLYNSVSRAAQDVLIFCPGQNLETLHDIISVTKEEDIVFEKLRSGDNLGSELFSNVLKKEDRLEVMKRIVVTNNDSQFKLLQDFFSREDTSNDFDWLKKQVLQLLTGSCSRSTQVLNMFKHFLQWTKSSVNERFLLQVLSMPFYHFYHDSSSRPQLQEILATIFGNIDEAIDQFDTQTNIQLANSAMLWGEEHVLLISLNKLSQERIETEVFTSMILISVLAGREENYIDHILKAFQGINIEAHEKRFLMGFISAYFSGTSMLVSLLNFFQVDAIQIFLAKEPMYKETLVHQFARNCVDECFQALLSLIPEEKLKFSDAEVCDHLKQTPLMMSLGSTKKAFWILERAKKQGDLEPLLAHKDLNGCSCLRWACIIDNMKVIKLLVEKYNFDWANDVDSQMQTLMHCACSSGSLQLLQYLLKLDEKQPEPYGVAKKLDFYGVNCLHVACIFGRVDLVRLLVKEVPELAKGTLFGMNCATIASLTDFESRSEMTSILLTIVQIQPIDVSQQKNMEFFNEKVRSFNFPETEADIENDQDLTNYAIPDLHGLMFQQIQLMVKNATAGLCHLDALFKRL